MPKKNLGALYTEVRAAREKYLAAIQALAVAAKDQGMDDIAVEAAAAKREVELEDLAALEEALARCNSVCDSARFRAGRAFTLAGEPGASA